ncbi:MAG TPA: hypothetical protein VIG99_06285, partial [Myxococcaceae bacterium]
MAGDEDEGGGGTQPVDILRWPNMEHRFNKESPLSVGLISPVNVGFDKTPVNVGFTEAPANVNMNIITPKGVGVNLMGCDSPIALRIVIPEEEKMICQSAYNISFKI